jgi:hypothetical protein
MDPIRVSIVNASTVLKDADIPPVMAALQVQVSQHLAPKWHVDATLEFVPFGTNAPDGDWRLELLDDTDISPDSGYHNVEPGGTPFGRVFIKTALEHKEIWTITASHELLEMLVNPYIVFAAFIPSDDNAGTFYQLEICDPVSPDENGYQINGISVSDFVFPEWFSPFLAEPRQGEVKQVDHCNHLKGPAPLIVPGTTISASAVGWGKISSPSLIAEARLGKDATTLFKRLRSSIMCG